MTTFRLQWVSFFGAVAATATASTTISGCYDSAQALQEAIDELPRYDTHRSKKQNKIPELLLCPSAVLEVGDPLFIENRSVRIACASSSSDEGEPLCTIKSSPDSETRLLDVVSTSSKATPTVQLSRLRLENGESYDGIDEDGQDQEGSGGAVFAEGANLVLEDCRLINSVASQKGGALSVRDQGKPILFLVTRTIFQENLSIQEDDCHSIYLHQEHPGTTVELNTETDFLEEQRQLQGASNLDYWDDPAKASQALEAFVPAVGATLCF